MPVYYDLNDSDCETSEDNDYDQMTPGRTGVIRTFGIIVGIAGSPG